MENIKLRPGQDKVLNYSGGYMAIPSVPGAGKTFTLTALTAKLIDEERQLPGKILIVTYMNAAANNFRSRIGDFLEARGLSRSKGFEVMTLHSLAMKIIKEKPEVLFLPEDFQPMDEIEQIRFIQRETSRWMEENPQLSQSFLNMKPNQSSSQLKKMQDQWTIKINQVAREIISYLKSCRIKPEAISPLREKLGEHSLLDLCFSVYEQYEMALKLMGKLDFDDLIVNSIDMIKNHKELREKLQQTYTFILEDEAQDSSILQEELLMLLSDKHHNLVRVGDINQSIMSTFTISDPKLFKKFCLRDNTTVSEILVSSRSSRDIIQLANYLVKWTKENHPFPMARESLEAQYIRPVDQSDPNPNPSPKGYTIGTMLAKTRREEFQRIITSITKQLQTDKTVAVLLPNNYLMEELKELLEKEEVPYNEMSSFPKERTKATLVIGHVLDYIAHPHDNKKLIHLLRQLSVEALQNQKLLNFLSTCRLEELLYPMDGVSPDINDIVECSEWPMVWENLQFIKQFIEASHLEPEALVLYIAESLHFDELQMAIAQRIAGDIKYMTFINPGWRMGDLAEQLKQIKNLYNYFANIVYERNGFEAETGVVNLITYHKSKGLEFDTVFLACLTAEEFPASTEDKFKSDFWFLKDDYKNPSAICRSELDKLLNKGDLMDPMMKARVEIIQERLRLLYVGITRARENLLLSSHEAYDSDYGRRKVEPSQYFKLFKRHIEGRKAEHGYTTE